MGEEPVSLSSMSAEARLTKPGGASDSRDSLERGSLEVLTPGLGERAHGKVEVGVGAGGEGS